MPFLVGKHPFVSLKVKLPKENHWTAFDCLIDTGFSGGLAIPMSFKDDFPKNEFIEARFLLADNSEISADATFTSVEYQRIKNEVAVVFLGDSSLVGVEFLNQMKFCLDLRKNIVELE